MVFTTPGLTFSPQALDTVLPVGFVFQLGHTFTPSHITDRFTQCRVLHHVLDLQTLHCTSIVITKKQFKKNAFYSSFYHKGRTKDPYFIFPCVQEQNTLELYSSIFALFTTCRLWRLNGREMGWNTHTRQEELRPSCTSRSTTAKLKIYSAR